MRTMVGILFITISFFTATKLSSDPICEIKMGEGSPELQLALTDTTYNLNRYIGAELNIEDVRNMILQLELFELVKQKYLGPLSFSTEKMKSGWKLIVSEYDIYKDEPDDQFNGIDLKGSKELHYKAQAVLNPILKKYVGKIIRPREVFSDIYEVLKKLGTLKSFFILKENNNGFRFKIALRENQKVEKIIISGNSMLKGEEISEALMNRKGKVLDYEILLSVDVRAIVDHYYKKHGLLYSGIIKSPFDIDVKGGDIHIKLSEFKLGSIDIRPNGNLNRDQLRFIRNKLDVLKLGEVLKRNELISAVHSVYDLPFVSKVRYSANYDDKNDNVTIILDVKTGDKETEIDNRWDDEIKPKLTD